MRVTRFLGQSTIFWQNWRGRNQILFKIWILYLSDNSVTVMLLTFWCSWLITILLLSTKSVTNIDVTDNWIVFMTFEPVSIDMSIVCSKNSINLEIQSPDILVKSKRYYVRKNSQTHYQTNQIYLKIPSGTYSHDLPTWSITWSWNNEMCHFKLYWMLKLTIILLIYHITLSRLNLNKVNLAILVNSSNSWTFVIIFKWNEFTLEYEDWVNLHNVQKWSL